MSCPYLCFLAYHCVHVGYIEADTSEEVGNGGELDQNFQNPLLIREMGTMLPLIVTENTQFVNK